MRFPPALSDRRVGHAIVLAVVIGAAVGIRLPSFSPDAARAPAATFRGHDGRRHVYLGGYDAYYWLELARTLLATGTPCDRIEGGACIDARGNAPVGALIEDPHSPQIGAIAAAHLVLARLDPGIPLSTSAMVVPVVIAALGAVAAYTIGVLASGPAGGVLAALLVSCNPVVLGRTIEGDDDIWLVVLPLAICCASAFALRATRRWPCVLWSAFAGALLGLASATWEGWPFFAVVAVAGIVTAGVVRRDQRALTVLAVLCATSVGCALVLGVRPNGSAIVAEALRFAHLAPPRSVARAPLPNTFAAVAELRGVNAFDLIGAFGVPAVAFALVGFGPLAALVRRRTDAARRAGPVWYVLVAWLAVSLVVAFDALRYVMLAAVPLAALAGAGAGTIVAALRVPARASVREWCVRAIVVAVVAGLAVAPAIAQGVAVVRVQSPEINAAWIATLRDIRNAEPSSAIIDVWWDRGHWAKYFARRAVSNDGATLGNSTNYWLALALAAPSDQESVRYLRMIDCGDVVDPLTGERARPYETLLRWLRDDGAAYRTLTALMQSPPARHRAVLAAAGLDARRAAALLRTVDCAPPATVLLLSTGLLADQSWYLDGFWDPYRAAAPQGRVIDTSWSACAMDRTLLRCPTPAGVIYADPAEPAHVALLAGDLRVPLSFAEIVRPDGPATVVQQEQNPNAPAVIVDAAHLRAFVGMPAVVRSTVVRLTLLGGGDDPLFTPAALHVAPNGEAVSSWRVRWAGSATAPAAAAR